MTTSSLNGPPALAWLAGPTPHETLAQLRATGELARMLPEVDALYGIPQSPQHHPEVDTGKHIELTLEAAAMLSQDPTVRFAALVHDLGKGLTPQAEWPQHINHERSGKKPVAAVCVRFAVPDDWRALALLVCEHHLNIHRAFEMSPSGVIRFLHRIGFASSSELLEPFLVAVEADKRGRTGHLHREYRQGAFMREAHQILVDIPYPAGVTLVMPQGQILHRVRLSAIAAAQAKYMRQAQPA